MVEASHVQMIQALPIVLIIQSTLNDVNGLYLYLLENHITTAEIESSEVWLIIS
jgi:hypothetical protein